jgi:hypothetical protein
MAKAFLLLIGLIAAPAAAADPQTSPVTADAAMARYREAFEPLDAVDCPKSTDPDEIFVCGRAGAPDPDRLPLPVEPAPGDRVNGEPVTAVAAMGPLNSCTTVGPSRSGCTGTLPVVPMIMTAVKVAVKLIRNDD